jgi:hypothetical protein
MWTAAAPPYRKILRLHVAARNQLLCVLAMVTAAMAQPPHPTTRSFDFNDDLLPIGA